MRATGRPVEQHHVRQSIDVRLPTAADLDAFCLDYFPEVARRFSQAMERTDKVNLLFQLVGDLDRIVERLPAAPRPRPQCFPDRKPQRAMSLALGRWVGILMTVLVLGWAGYQASRRCRRADSADLMLFQGGKLVIVGSEGTTQTRQVRPFRLDRTEVAQVDYERWAQTSLGCQSQKAAGFETRKADFPAVNVSYEEAERYCQCRGAHLPTEEEWIFAARGREGRPFPWGTDPPAPGRVNLCFAPPCQLQPVSGGADDVTPDGVLHMGGNAREWVRGEEGPNSHRLMGGSYLTPVDFNKQAGAQFGSFAGGRDQDIGFRCAEDIR